MLSELHIRDFAIVHRLELSLRAGLSVLTGETGAGKSILIDALALALGERADANAIRQGCARSEVSARFELRPEHDAVLWLKEHDLYGDNECLLRRVIEKDKPSKGYINGRPLPIQMLRELGELLVDIHGQHEHQSLLKREAQRQMLDDYAGLGAALAALASHAHELKALTARRESLRREGADRAARIELLSYQVQELKALDLAADEIPRLEEEHARLANASELLQGVQATAQALYDDEEGAAARILAQSQHRIETLSRYDSKLAAFGQLLNEALIQVEEAAAGLHQYLDGLELDPQRLAWVESRIGAAHNLALKHKVRAEELPAVCARLATELDDLQDFDVNLEKLDRQIEDRRAAYLQLARQISEKRQPAALALAREVSEQLQGLGMPGGVFEVSLTPRPEDELSAHGLEQVEFRVSANPGQSPRPLNKVASGGELSRISLGLQVVTARIGRIPTLIFDEVDVGIGGGVAEIVGRQLRRLGDNRQVLCITHLAQVAAQGHHHLKVSKLSRDGEVMTRIQPLPEEERIGEIARMLGGVEITHQTMALASDMLSRVSA